MYSAKLCQWHSLIVYWYIFSKQRMQIHLWLILFRHRFSFCGSFCLLGVATFPRCICLICQDLISQFCEVLDFWAEQQRHVNNPVPCGAIPVIGPFYSSSLALFWARLLCHPQQNWHLFRLKKWPRIYGGSYWKLCSKLQLSALVRNGLQAVLMNALVKTKTDCKWTAHSSRAFHEVSLFTGDRWKLLPRLGERSV